MRRFIPFLVAAVLVAGAGGAVSASQEQCSISVSPRVGGPDDAFIIRGRGFPAGTFEEPVHVLLEIRYPGPGRMGTVFFVHLAPGSTWFDVTFHGDDGTGEPWEPLAPGRYRVLAEDETHACRDRSSFRVQAERPEGRRVPV